MATRANSAYVAKRTKDRLVQVLFGNNVGTRGRAVAVPQHNQKGATGHTYTHKQLRRAYLQKLQEIHPDKHHHHRRSFKLSLKKDEHGKDVTSQKNQQQEQQELLMDLQSAWSDYAKVAQSMQRVRSGGTRRHNHRKPPSRLRRPSRGAREADATHHSDYEEEEDEEEEEANFTMFGVGCSFADTPSERQMRHEIMEQASRGFFVAGVIPAVTEASSTKKSQDAEDAGITGQQRPLLEDDDGMFSTVSSVEQNETSKQKNDSRTNRTVPVAATKMKSLVQGMQNIPHRSNK